MKEDKVKVFVDTNVLIYAFDRSAGAKHELGSEIVMGLWDSGFGVTSTQVLQEFFVNVTRKIPKPMEGRLAKQIISDLLKWDIVINDGDSILDAVDIHLRYGYSFWDALIIEAALQAGASFLLTEDLSHGQTLRGLTIRNPFLDLNKAS